MQASPDSGGTTMAPTAAPWASASEASPEEQHRLLQEKLARARAMKPVNAQARPSPPTHVSPGSPVHKPVSPHLNPRSPRSPGLVVAPWALENNASDDEEQQQSATSPPTPPVVVDVAGKPTEFRFCSPVKHIKTNADLTRFQASEAYATLKGFIISLNEACKGKALNGNVQVSGRCQAIIDALHTISGWIDEIPPIEQPMRYGNKAFRDWMDKARADMLSLVQGILPDKLKGAAIELAPYLAESFGNKERIDYGTGHELTFVTFLAALAEIGYLEESDQEAIALRIFWEYLKVARKLQLTYRLEPAGSHGCWSLDDYQFIPFLWGSAQLIGHPSIFPHHIHDARVVKENADAYYYLHCIKFITEVKSGHLAENSPMLNDISGCPTWQRVNAGMVKMFFAEVMDKLPVIQHMLFGSIFKAS